MPDSSLINERLSGNDNQYRFQDSQNYENKNSLGMVPADAELIFGQLHTSSSSREGKPPNRSTGTDSKLVHSLITIFLMAGI
jgi:hypothetical protein